MILNPILSCFYCLLHSPESMSGDVTGDVLYLKAAFSGFTCANSVVFQLAAVFIGQISTVTPEYCGMRAWLSISRAVCVLACMTPVKRISWKNPVNNHIKTYECVFHPACTAKCRKGCVSVQV